MDISYFLNNKEVNRPLNYKELSTELNYDKDDSSQAVSLNEWEWGVGSQIDGNDGATIINDWRKGGLTGGVGVFEGLPFRIELTHNSITRNLLDGYLDTSTALYDCDKVIVSSIERHNIDWLNDVADSWSFEKGFADGDFTNVEFIPIPYINSELPENREAFMASISLFILIMELVNQIEQLVEYIAELGTVINAVGAVVKIILRILYILVLFATIINTLSQLMNSLIQPVKYFHGMTVKRLCEIGASHFGFTFSSPIFDNAPFDKLTIIPEKFNHQVTDKGNPLFGGLAIGGGAFNIDPATNAKFDMLGFEFPSDPSRVGYFKGTYGELLRAMKLMFNAKILIEGTSLKLVRRDFNTSSPNYILPPVDKTDFSLNHEDFKSNYVVQFLTDINDKNTLQDYDGVITQVITEPKGIINKDLVLMKGLTEVNIPFARAKRKEVLTSPESTIKNIIDVLILVSGVPSILIYQILPFTNIASRIGMLSVENDFLDTSKIALIENNPVPRAIQIRTDNKSIVNSDYLYRNYHFIESFVESQSRPNANQYKIYEKIGIPFCFDDYELLRNNNFLKDDEGKSGELISATWNVERQTADIKFKINELYNNNLKETIITPDGK